MGHSDYFSGWEESELQRVLDNCQNESEGANPDAFCSDWITFRGKGKTEGEQVDDDTIVEELAEVQPQPVDTRATISPEMVTNVAEIPPQPPTPSPPTTIGKTSTTQAE